MRKRIFYGWRGFVANLPYVHMDVSMPTAARTLAENLDVSSPLEQRVIELSVGYFVADFAGMKEIVAF